MTPEGLLRGVYKADPDRLCACGCGEKVDRPAGGARYRFECKKRIEREQSNRYRLEKRKKQNGQA